MNVRQENVFLFALAVLALSTAAASIPQISVSAVWFTANCLLIVSAILMLVVVRNLRATYRKTLAATRQLRERAGERDHSARRLAEREGESGPQSAGSVASAPGSPRTSMAESQFLARMSHEMRTPMNGIIGMLELLNTANLTREEREHLDLARDSAGSLVRLLNDILDFSKIEAGRFELETVRFDFREVLFGSLRTLQIRAAEKQVRFAVRVSPTVPAAVVGDPDRLRQVLINLVGNAVKFTDQGRITVAVGCHTINASEVWLEISVRDTGVGISAEDQKHIFEAFAQGDASTSRRFGGTGLGLAITSQLVELMGGRMRVQSEPGRGSTFSFRARFGVARGRVTAKPRHGHIKSENTPTEIAPPVRAANILVAEDGEVNQKVVTGLLSRRGHRVTVAENGRAAVRLLEQGSFDLVLMDIEMPEMDGLEATRVIRRREQLTGQHTPIVAMTAHAIKGDRERFLVAGMDDYIAKPFLKEQLYEAVERHAAKQRAADQQPVVGVASVKTANCCADSSSAADSAD